MSNWDIEYERNPESFQARPAAANALGLDDEFNDVPMDPVAPARQDLAQPPPPNADAGLVIRDANPEENTPLQQLIRHWMNERHSPEILPAQEDLLAGLLDHLRLQSRNVQILRDDPRTSESEHFRIMLVQTEIERVKFIIRSYVRTRLFKIEKYARFVTSNRDVQTRITASEREHASRHAKLTDQHLYLSVLQSLPDSQAHLDDTPIFYPSMVTEPDRSRPVFVHALEDCPPVRLPDGNMLSLKRGDIYITPYQVVEHLVARGEAELV